ncbi:MAG: hypothetical protein V1674_01290 [Candidatus Omnitrophota bacterium]
MKNIIAVSILCLLVIFGISTTASYAGTEKYGEAISSRNITPIKDILANPAAFEGKTVTIEGKIASECPSGCWFYVKIAEGNLSIYVDIGKSGFAIPQKKGKRILVEGKVIVKKPGPMIQGKGVEVQ